MSTGTAEPTQQQQQVRKPPFADWPTIKILTPPQGRFSRKTDEWCFTYCSQNVNGRFYGREPSCRSVCIRKVFPHEIRNVVGFKSHRNVGPDGKARYALPAEGQSLNLPKYLGGTAETSSVPSSSRRDPSNFWDEGWYLWTSNNRWAVHEKTDSMLMDLEQQQKLIVYKEQRREIWQEYQDHLQQAANPDQQQQEPSNRNDNVPSGKWWGPIVPLRPVPDVSSQSLLVSLPPRLPSIWDRIHKLLAPSRQVLEIVRESVVSGEQKQFAQRLWEKAWTNEPYILAGRTFTSAYERWKEKDVPGEGGGTKGST